MRTRPMDVPRAGARPRTRRIVLVVGAVAALAAVTLGVRWLAHRAPSVARERAVDRHGRSAARSRSRSAARARWCRSTSAGRRRRSRRASTRCSCSPARRSRPTRSWSSSPNPDAELAALERRSRRRRGRGRARPARRAARRHAARAGVGGRRPRRRRRDGEAALDDRHRDGEEGRDPDARERRSRPIAPASSPAALEFETEAARARCSAATRRSSRRSTRRSSGCARSPSSATRSSTRCTCAPGQAGVVQQVAVEAGQTVAAGAPLAKVVVPDHLQARLRIPEVVDAGRRARPRTRRSTRAPASSPARSCAIDPAAQNGSVTVDVKLDRRRCPRPRASIRTSTA